MIESDLIKRTAFKFNTFRGTDFPFQKNAFSVSENHEFRFNMVEKWKFRFPIEIVHAKNANSVYIQVCVIVYEKMLKTYK